MKDKKIPLVNVDKLLQKSNESELFDDLSRDEYFNWLKEHGYDFETLKILLENKRVSSSEQCRFNYILKKAKLEMDVKVCESVLYLEEYFVKTKRILNLLDGELMFMLKNELSEKYKIKTEFINLDELERISIDAIC